jgi:hypothetical protein
MAIVPLEGRGDPRTQEFVNSKSDVKFVEYGSCGVPAVYADVLLSGHASCLRTLVDMGTRKRSARTRRVFENATSSGRPPRKVVRRHRFALRRSVRPGTSPSSARGLPAPMPLVSVA